MNPHYTGHPFLHAGFYVSGRSARGAGLPSHSGRFSNGGAGSSPPAQRAAALGEADGELLKLRIDIGETRGQLHGARRKAAIADVADLPRESTQNNGSGRLLYSAHHSLSGAVRISWRWLTTAGEFYIA